MKSSSLSNPESTKEHVAQTGLDAKERTDPVPSVPHAAPKMQQLLDAFLNAVIEELSDDIRRLLLVLMYLLHDRIVLDIARILRITPEDAQEWVTEMWLHLEYRIRKQIGTDACTEGSPSKKPELNYGYLTGGAVLAFRNSKRRNWRQSSREKSLTFAETSECDRHEKLADPADTQAICPQEALERSILTRKVKTILAMLSREDQIVLAMRADGATFAEIGVEVGRSEENIRKTDLPNAKSAFRKAWQVVGGNALDS